MIDEKRCNLVEDLLLPTLLFAALGGMTWAVRGCSGFGAVAGCIFAGVTWGAAWWYLSHDPRQEQSRRYSSGWIVLAVTLGIGLSCNRGWMQWPSFFEGKLLTNASTGAFVPISKSYGFLWLFIAGVPWAGIGACALAWCGSARETRLWHWAIRIGCGVGAAELARYLIKTYPQDFLPLYSSLERQYHDRRANPNLQRLIGDCTSAMVHMGYYLGFLAFEFLRRDWKNIVLILTVGLVNGAGWALCQNWKWANEIWGTNTFNFWRCWESSGGISIGVAYGLAYFLVNRRMSELQREAHEARHVNEPPRIEWLAIYGGLTYFIWRFFSTQLDGWATAYFTVVGLFGVLYALANRGIDDHGQDPDSQRWGLYLGLLTGLGLSLRNGLKGWFNIYRGNENYWSGVLWKYLGPTYLVLLILIALWILLRPASRNSRRDYFPHAYALIWLVLLVQNAIAQLITGPHTQWSETAFAIYYALLFAITALIVLHVRVMKSQERTPRH
jgi:hypothetical protein